MKKIINIFVFSMIFSTSVFAAANRTELKIWESSGTESAFIQYAMKAYRKVNPKVHITYEPVESTDSRNKIELDGPAGVGADIFVAPHDHIGALVAGGHILPIDDSAEYLSDFLDLAKKASTYNSVAYGYPLGAETYVLFYNKDIVSKPAKTWKDVTLYAKEWNDKSDNKFALTWIVSDPYYDYMFLDSFGAPLFGPDGNDPKQHNLNSAGAIAGLTYFQKLKNLIFDVTAMDASRDFVHSSFINGKSPMIITGCWKINEFKKAGMNFGTATLPVFPDQNKPATSFSGVRLAFVSSYSEHQAEAKDFAKFLTSKEMLQKRFEITDQIPPRKDIEINNEYSKAVMDQLKNSKPMPTIIQLGTFWSIMGPAFSGIWQGNDVKKTLDMAAAAMDAKK